MQYTVNHSETSLIFIEASKIGTLSKAIPKIKGNVRTVVYWGSSSSGDVEAVKKEVSPCLIQSWKKVLSEICKFPNQKFCQYLRHNFALRLQLIPSS